VKSSEAARVAYISSRFPHLTSEQKELVASSEDAFDAAVSALVMDQHTPEFASLTRTEDPVALLEGLIWAPTLASKIEALSGGLTLDMQTKQSQSLPKRLAGRLGSILTRFAERP
jgi:hypothetical protein